jgi:hypothetical protein
MGWLVVAGKSRVEPAPAVCQTKAIKGCITRNLPDDSAFRKRKSDRRDWLDAFGSERTD